MIEPGEAILVSWRFDPWLGAGLLLPLLVYLRGWRVYRARDPERWPIARPMAFAGGLACVALALASPIEALTPLLLSLHMVQHLLFMMVIPPLIWLGNPLLPMIRGLPQAIRAYWVAPLLQQALLGKLFSFLANPAAALALFILATWAWHSPALYSLALESPEWHYVQHACFLFTGLLFWFPVIRPYPFRPAWPVVLLFPYLIVADLSNTALSSLLTFSDRVLYPHYLEIPPIYGGSALEDQAAAGVLMWVPGSLVYLLPLVGIGLNVLAAPSFGNGESIDRINPKRPRKTHEFNLPAASQGERIALPLLGAVPSSPRRDLLKWPLIGRFLRWRYARPALQLPMLVLAAAVVVDGLSGPDVAPMNLAGVLVWVHWRGLLIIAIVLGGNFFCTACPFTLPRWFAGKFLPRGRQWPRALRGKWLAIGLLTLFFCSYEAFSLWDRPRLTAGIVLGYFIAAFLVDGLFRGAAFCKYVCPIGQFNFVQSLVSPLEVRVRDAAVCASCQTKDCIRGRGDLPGCGLDLFLPVKRGNMDCTFCLDCIHACPHDNIGIQADLPARSLQREAVSSTATLLSRRLDLAALIIALVFAAFINAAGMTGPILEWELEIQHQLGLKSPRLMVLVLEVVSLLMLPLAAIGATAWLSRLLGKLKFSTLQVAARFSGSLVPLGCAMWLAHYGFHLATSYESAWPVLQRFAAACGWSVLGEPAWSCACCDRAGEWLTKAELVALDFGLLLSLYLLLPTARCVSGARQDSLMSAAPWALLIVLLFAAGVWIVLQPMQMRGTMI